MSESPPSLPRQHVRSLSQLNLYAQCGERFRLERLVKVPQKPAAWFPQGVALHSAIEAWERSGRVLTPGECETIFLDSYDAGIQKLLTEWPEYSDWIPDGIRKVTTSIEHRRNAGTMHVAAYLASAKTAPWKVWELPDGEPALEVGFRLDFGGVLVTGFIDKIREWNTGALDLEDYKSGKVPDDARQLGLYAVAANETFGTEIHTGQFWLGQVRKGTETPKGSTEHYDLRGYTYEHFAELFNELDKGISEGVFLPNVGDHCRICGVRDACRAMQASGAVAPTAD